MHHEGSSTVAVLGLHGAGSSGATARRLLHPLIAEAVACDNLVENYPDMPTGRIDDLIEVIETFLADVDAHVEEKAHVDKQIVLIGGISLGAHAIVHALSGRRLGRANPILLLALPAWTGVSTGTSDMTLAAADEIERCGVDAVLVRLGAATPEHRRWIVDSLAADWSTYDQAALVRAMRDAGRSPGPTPTQLRSLAYPAVVIGADDDEMHPLAESVTWAEVIPNGTQVTTSLTEMGDRGLASPRAIARLARVVRDYRAG